MFNVFLVSNNSLKMIFTCRIVIQYWFFMTSIYTLDGGAPLVIGLGCWRYVIEGASDEGTVYCCCRWNSNSVFHCDVEFLPLVAHKHMISLLAFSGWDFPSPPLVHVIELSDLWCTHLFCEEIYTTFQKIQMVGLLGKPKLLKQVVDVVLKGMIL